MYIQLDDTAIFDCDDLGTQTQYGLGVTSGAPAFDTCRARHAAGAPMIDSRAA